MNGNNDQTNVIEPLMKFWQDAFARMPAGSFMPGQTPNADTVASMRKAFFDALAKACDEYMRSPQFLDAMKQSMDQSLAFRKQVNQFLSSTLQGMQMTTQEDMSEVLKTLRAIETGLQHRFEEISARVERLEGGNNRKGAAKAAKDPRVPAKGGTKPAGRKR